MGLLSIKAAAHRSAAAPARLNSHLYRCAAEAFKPLCEGAPHAIPGTDSTARLRSANLAAFFNQPDTILSGPASMSELRSATACTVFDEGWSPAKTVSQYVERIHWPRHLPTFEQSVTSIEFQGVVGASQTERMDWCIREVREGRADICARPGITELHTY